MFSVTKEFLYLKGERHTHQTLLPFLGDPLEVLRSDCHTLLEMVRVVRAVAQELWHIAVRYIFVGGAL